MNKINKQTEAINNIVKECLEEHEGGEVFFDNLDEKIREKGIIDTLIKFVSEKEMVLPYNLPQNIVVSGKFGRTFSSLYTPILPIIVFNGGLRKGEKIDSILEGIDVKGERFIFIDDSFYSGKTRDVIKEELERNGATLEQTYVVYDGSLEKDENVHSLYRYYDNVKEVK